MRGLRIATDLSTTIAVSQLIPDHKSDSRPTRMRPVVAVRAVISAGSRHVRLHLAFLSRAKRKRGIGQTYSSQLCYLSMASRDRGISSSSHRLHLHLAVKGVSLGITAMVNHHIAAAPIGLDKILNPEHLQLLTNLADKYINNLRVQLIEPTV